MRRASARLLLLVGLALATPAFAEPTTVVVSHERVRLGDIAPEVPAQLQSIDLGPAPQPGSSRLFSADEVAEKLRVSGISASKLSLPGGVRVETEAKRFAPEELASLVEEPLRSALPVGVKLKSLKAHQGHVLAPVVRAGAVRLPKFAYKDGEQTQTATVEILWGSQVLMRLPVQIVVEVRGQEAGALVARGTSLSLVIVRGQVEISAIGETLSAGRVGENVPVRVTVTKKVVTAKLRSAERAEVEL